MTKSARISLQSLRCRGPQICKYTCCQLDAVITLTLISTQTRLLGDGLHTRLVNIDATVKASSEEQEYSLEQVIDKLDEDNKQIRAGNAITTKICDALRLDWGRQLDQELKTPMWKIFFTHIVNDV